MPKALSPEARAIVTWRQDPTLFMETMWGKYKRPQDDTLLDVWQREANQAILENDFISIRSGHGTGKTAWLSWVIIWWMLVKDEPRVPCTAPTSHQLNDALWGELSKWIDRLPPSLRNELEVKADRVECKRNPSNLYATARTARKETPEAFQGYHSGDLLFIADEASGIDDIIFEVGEGSQSTHGAKTILTGNPTRTSGYFFDSHNRLRGDWFAKRVSSEDAKMVNPDWVARMAKRHGIDSNVYKVRVLGEFPDTDSDAIIPYEWAESAIDRDVEPAFGREIWGLDVGRGGDDSALCKRAKNVVNEIKTWTNKDTMQTVGRVVKEYNESQNKPYMICADVIGLGAGVVDRLSELGLPVKGVNVGETHSVSEGFVRLRDELYWRAREWFESRSVRIPNDGDFIGELTCLNHELMSNGKVAVETKKQAKMRGIKSPNMSDSFILTFAESDELYETYEEEPQVYYGEYGWMM